MPDLIIPRSIVIDGSPVRVGQQTQYLVRVSDFELSLPRRLFRVMALLALNRDYEEGWMFAEELYSPAAQASLAVVNLRKQIHIELAVAIADHIEKGDGRRVAIAEAVSWRVCEQATRRRPDSPKYVCHRLKANPESIQIMPNLAEFEDYDLGLAYGRYVKRHKQLMAPVRVGSSHGRLQ